MFGYLFPSKQYLSLNQRKAYRNYFCSLCLSHKYNYGKLAMWLNNFDLGVIAVISEKYTNDIEDCGRCGKKIEYKREKFTNPRWRNLVDLNINLVRKKVEDDINDNNSIGSKIKYLIFRSVFSTTKRSNPKLYFLTDSEYSRYMEYEERDPGINQMLKAWTTFMSNMLQAAMDIDKKKITFLNGLMKWVYWIDAIDDYDENIRYNCFNPYFSYSSERNKREFIANNIIQIIEQYKMIIEEIKEAYLKCNYTKRDNIIIENIIKHTIPETTRLILEGGTVPKKRRLL